MSDPAARMSGAVEWQPGHVPGAGHQVPVRIFRPAAGHRGWLVWAHGGSWHSGSVAGWHRSCADLARLAGCAVLSVDYRLAPDHPHPAALEDVLAAVEWAQQKSDQEGLPAVSVGGDSSGATIAASAAVVLRDEQRPLTAQLLAYPPLDPECRAPSYTRYFDNFPSPELLATAWRSYRRNGTKVPASLPSTPFEVEDLTGLAPAVLGVGEFDAVADDVREYARRLARAGNDLEFEEFPRMMHGAFLQPGHSGAGSTGPHALRPWLAAALGRRLAAAGAPLDSGSLA
ncbi:alpha/beta hydrolase [Streptomyces sp. NPDC091272]|uniref:alpha/beta hydrolase n=1 Tax=Streptomyces sp. NPDC091272 TaxID=3365981 RepID=UPI003823084F